MRPAPLPASGEAVTRAKRALARYRAYRHGTAKRLTVTADYDNEARRVCRATWHYHERRYRKTVTVTKLAADRYQVRVS